MENPTTSLKYQATVKDVSSIGMTVVLVSFSMLFLTMFLGYFVYRMSAGQWPPMGMERVPLLTPTMSTVFILVSSLCFEIFVRFFKDQIVDRSRKYLVLSILSGIMFLASQVKLWSVMEDTGLYISEGIFPSILYAFTWIHFAHVAVALVLLGACFYILLNQSWDRLHRVRSFGVFWHFLGIVWVLMYLTLFVI